MKKRRNDAWDTPLTEAQRWEAYERSKGVPWPTFAAWLAEEYGLRVGKTAIYEWMAFMRRQEGAHRLERAIAARQELKGLADYAALDARTADAYLALANDATLSGYPDRAAKIVEMAVKINAASLRLAEQRQQAERLDLQRQELALKRERFEAAEKRLADATGVAADETLSETERLARIKTIFGLP